MMVLPKTLSKKNPDVSVHKRWCQSSIDHLILNEEGHIDIVFSFSTSSRRHSGMFLAVMPYERNQYTIEMGRYQFLGFLVGAGFLGNIDIDELFKNKSSLIGFEFDAQMLLTIDGHFLKPWRHMEARLLDVAPRLGKDLSQYHARALINQVAQSHCGPIFFESATSTEFHAAGYRPARQYTYGDSKTHFTSDYERREAVFEGWHHNGKRMVHGGRKRTSMLIIAEQFDIENGWVKISKDLTTFLCIRQQGGVHVILPVYAGLPEWRIDKTDADVGQIIADIRRNYKQDLLTTDNNENGDQP